MKPTPDTIVMPLNPINKAIALILFVTQFIAFGFAFFFFFIHYTIYPLHSIFASPSLCDKTSGTFSPLKNTILYSLFFIQHIVLATFVFKRGLKNIIKSYPLYERYIYNISSVVVLYYLYTMVQLDYRHAFYINQYASLAATLLGFVFLNGSLMQLSGNLFFPYPIKQLISKDQIIMQEYGNGKLVGLKSNKFYGLCRHPMQFGNLLILIFGSYDYTYDRIVFLAVNSIWMAFAIYGQEKRTEKCFKDYAQYRRKVPYVLIPYII